MRFVVLLALFGLLAFTSARLHSSHLAPVEDSDAAALERAENNLSDQELEEEEEEVPAKIRNVINDAHAVRRALEEAEMDDGAKEAAIRDADQIALEAEELVHASPAHARKLKQEMKQHMAHLKSVEARQNVHEQEEEDEESPAGRVVRDVAEVQSQIEADERLSAHKKAQASNILERMATHARNFPSASSSAKREIKQMLRSELEELKSVVGEERQLEESDNELEEEEAPIRHSQDRRELEEEKAAKVEGDVEEIKREIRHADLPSAVRQAANANLDAIARDAEEYPSAPAARQHDLQKAMKLRVAALREQLGEN
jgi:hypothetical protein